MTDIFISYAHEDEMRIREIVHALEEERWSIFWDRRIPAGKTWESYIGQALSDARCVIVAWSQHSITSGWVKEEANDAKDRGVLVPVFLDPVKPPLGFRGIQAADLTEWKPGYSSPQFDQLIQDIAGVLGAKPPHEPAPPKHGPPETRQQEPEPTKLKSPTSKKRPNFLIGAGIALSLAIVVGSALWFTLRLPRPPEPKAIEPQITGESQPSQEAERMPSLAVPQDGSTVSQPYVQPWLFRWDEPRAPSKVQQYHLRVIGANAAYPVVDVKMNGTEHTISRKCSYIIERNRLGWKWQVRAQFQDGTWGPWAGPSTFDVSPFNKERFCQQCPDAKFCQENP